MGTRLLTPCARTVLICSWCECLCIDLFSLVCAVSVLTSGSNVTGDGWYWSLDVHVLSPVQRSPVTHTAYTMQETETCVVLSCNTTRQPLPIPSQDTLRGGRRHGQLTKCWTDNVKEWTSMPMPKLLTLASRQKRPEDHLR